MQCGVQERKLFGANSGISWKEQWASHKSVDRQEVQYSPWQLEEAQGTAEAHDRVALRHTNSTVSG